MAVWHGRRRADLGDSLALMSRRFPLPWSVDETGRRLQWECFIVPTLNH
jgi:hypothetical protein